LTKKGQNGEFLIKNWSKSEKFKSEKNFYPAQTTV